MKKAVSQEDMRKQDSFKQQQHPRYFQARDPYGRDPYAPYRAAYGGAYGDYRTMGGYDYRYPQAEQYMRAADSYMTSGYTMPAGGYGDRTAATAAAYAAAGYQQPYGRGYDMSTYTNMYAGGATGPGMGTYPQAGSTYGPARGYVDPTKERDRGVSSRAYHPYKR